MKKYYSLSAASLSLSALALLAGCQDYEGPDGGAEAQKQAYLKEQDAAYTDAFTKAFGEVDPKQDFGMKEPLQPMGWGISTRAGSVNTNRNQWIDRKNDDPEPNWYDKEYRADALAHDIIIPGWPNFDNRYYGNRGSSVLEKPYVKSELNSSIQPCGDVTDYEIQYVSAWFRTHEITDPTQYREELHLSDFFIQNVSCDNDQIAYGELSNPTQKIGTNGENITSGEQNTQYITRKNNSKETINYALDQLCFKDMAGEWTHVNNFNNQNSNFNPEEASKTPNREIKYITSSGTEDFQCHPSFNTDPNLNWIDSWVLVRLTWKEPDQEGVLHDREGYYLAFDFQAKKQDTEVACDHYYSNWIVKITPGNFEPTGVAKRIMCEDLGGTFDFDFNDVVFDVALSGSDAVISVQAAGGTMPIYLAGKETVEYEIHKLLGSNTHTQPINALGDYTYQHAPAIFRVTKGTITTAEDIDIKVCNTKDNQEYHVNGKRDNNANPNSNLDNKTENPYGSPTTKEGTVAPRAFAVPTNVKWMKELKFIETSYPGFDDWVANANYMYQPSNDAPKLHWYEQSSQPGDDSPSGNLYYSEVKLINGSPTGWKQTLPAQWQTLQPIEDTYADAAIVGSKGCLRVHGYTGSESIIDNFTNHDAKMITLTVIVKSDLEFTAPTYDGNGYLSNPNSVLRAILIPADKLTDAEKTEHTGATMKYKGHYFSKSNINDWRVVQFQDYNNPDEPSSILSGHQNFTGLNYTYALKMTFTKDQIMQSETKYVDNIHFFIQVPDGKHAEIYNWHVHY